MAKISIIVPVYNVAAYLDACVKSLLSQTMTDIEIVLVEDCSKDNSLQLAERWCEQDPRIRLVRHEKNRGLSAARNSGIEASSAPYIAFVDSDDVVAPRYCEALYDALTQNNADVALCGTEWIDQAGNPLPDEGDAAIWWNFPFKENPTRVTDDVIECVNVCTWNRLYKRAVIEKYHLRFPIGYLHEDEYWWRMYSCYASRMAWTREKLYGYRQRSDSIMSLQRKIDKPNVDFVRGCALFAHEVKTRGLTEYYGRAIRAMQSSVYHDLSRARKAATPGVRATMEATVFDAVKTTFADLPWKKDEACWSQQAFWAFVNHIKTEPVVGGLLSWRYTYNTMDLCLFGVLPLWRRKFFLRKVKGRLLGFLPMTWTMEKAGRVVTTFWGIPMQSHACQVATHHAA